MDEVVERAIATIPDHAWTTIEYTNAVFDQTTGRWVSRAEVAEIDFVAFAAEEVRSRPGSVGGAQNS